MTAKITREEGKQGRGRESEGQIGRRGEIMPPFEHIFPFLFTIPTNFFYALPSQAKKIKGRKSHGKEEEEKGEIRLSFLPLLLACVPLAFLVGEIPLSRFLSLRKEEEEEGEKIAQCMKKERKERKVNRGKKVIDEIFAREERKGENLSPEERSKSREEGEILCLI